METCTFKQISFFQSTYIALLVHEMSKGLNYRVTPLRIKYMHLILAIPSIVGPELCLNLEMLEARKLCILNNKFLIHIIAACGILYKISWLPDTFSHMVNITMLELHESIC